MIDFRKFKAIRENHNMSISDLANEIDVDEKTILYWENGKTKKPGLDTRKKLSKVFFDGDMAAMYSALENDSEDTASEAVDFSQEKATLAACVKEHQIAPFMTSCIEPLFDINNINAIGYVICSLLGAYRVRPTLPYSNQLLAEMANMIMTATIAKSSGATQWMWRDMISIMQNFPTTTNYRLMSLTTSKNL